jgi:GT2 family glycosyltransferase
VVYAIIPAYGRPALLARALESLADQGPRFAGVIIVNNSGGTDIERAARAAALPVRLVTPPCNLGTSGGIAAGLGVFLSLPQATHAWILDDDSVATPGALDAMLDAMIAERAEAAAPLLADEHDRVRWIPCRVPGKPRSYFRQGPSPDQFRKDCGDGPRKWAWEIWASVLLSRRAVLTAGYPRVDLWSQFSDIEYTLRVTRQFSGILVPASVCRHLPPPEGPGFDAKLHSALQNGNYVTTRLKFGWRAFRHWPGQHFRYLRHYRWHPKAWWRAATAFWLGAVRAQPSSRTVHRAAYEAAAPYFDAAGAPRADLLATATVVSAAARV